MLQFSPFSLTIKESTSTLAIGSRVEILYTPYALKYEQKGTLFGLNLLYTLSGYYIWSKFQPNSCTILFTKKCEGSVCVEQN